VCLISNHSASFQRLKENITYLFVQVNESEVISTTWDGDSRTNLVRNSFGEPLLQTAYNQQLKPTSLALSTGRPPVNMGYDK